MDSCAVCGGQDFYLESGFYFCKECQTQQEGTREQVVDYNPSEHNTRVIKVRVRKNKNVEEDISGWTTWEKYNFIMIGLANQLIDLGASPDIKLTLLQLWATYLNKLEVAFNSTTKKILPKLARFDKKDVQIIYGANGVSKKKKKVKKTDGSSVAGTSMVSESSVSRRSLHRDFTRKKSLLMKSEYKKYMESQGTSEADYLSECSFSSSQTIASSASGKPKRKIRKSVYWLNKAAREDFKNVEAQAKSMPRSERKKFRQKHMSASFKAGPRNITQKRLWAIVYLALRINNEKLHLSDMLRYAREGHLSYFRLEHFFPPEVTLSTTEIKKINPFADLGSRSMRGIINQMAKFLRVWELPHTDLASLLRKFCTELQLPEGIYLYAERLLASSPPGMNFSGRTVYFPNYEGRVMAIIIVVMKILFGLDGITEYKISRVIERINMVAKEKNALDSRLFNFREWQRYIECRRCILVNEHLPTKLKRDPSASENSHLYVKFIQSLGSKLEIDPHEKRTGSYVSPQLARIMKQEIERLQINDSTMKEIPSFPPSLTPQHSYLQQLLQDPSRTLPSILYQDFSSTKVGYTTRPESLLELAAESNIELNYVDGSPHFVEKIVPIFGPYLLPDIRWQRALNINNELIKVVTPISTDNKVSANSYQLFKSDDPSEYLHRKHPGTIFIDSKKQRLFRKLQKLEEINKQNENVEVNDFEFDQIDTDGKLKIPDDYNDCSNENENSTNEVKSELTDLEKNYNLILSNFEKQTMLGPVENPWEEEKRFKYDLKHQGKFIKRSEANENIKKNQKIDEIKIEDDDIPNDKIKKMEEEASDSNPVVSDSDELLILAESIKPKQNTSDKSTLETEQMTFFRPFKEYWLRRCQHFSHIFPPHFRLLERNLPINFRWLLHECAHVVEITVEELYEEVCLVENYFGYVFTEKYDSEKCKKWNTEKYRSQTYRNSIKNKWNT